MAEHVFRIHRDNASIVWIGELVSRKMGYLGGAYGLIYVEAEAPEGATKIHQASMVLVVDTDNPNDVVHRFNAARDRHKDTLQHLDNQVTAARTHLAKVNDEAVKAWHVMMDDAKAAAVYGGGDD